MSKINVKVKKLHKEAKLPLYAKDGDAGADLYSVEEVIGLKANERALISTGIAIELPEGYEAQIRPRSGMAFKQGLTVLNSPGTIDTKYRGQIKVIIYNASNKTVDIPAGTKIAQMVVKPVEQANFKEVKELSDSERGTDGFGSTGV